jgi:putative GTP pyrophosphokinase
MGCCISSDILISMTFAPKPPHSKGKLNRAGVALAAVEHASPEYKEALNTVNEWRTCHAYPLNTFNSTLRHKVRKYNGALVAQRLKRLPTIIDKLKRYPDMNLAQMQDIGGIRAVVNTIGEAIQLRAEYTEPGRFTHILKREHDYIQCPKPDGYRGIHLVFEYNNTLSRNGLAQDYKGLLVEMQLRTHLQHTWATAVETIGTLLGESFKTGTGSADWKEFLALVSSAFAIAENSQTVVRHSNLSPNEIYKSIKHLEAKLSVIEHIHGFAAAAKHINNDKGAGYYNIIVLDIANRKLSIYAFGEHQLELATTTYAELEAKSTANTDQVLVRAGDLKSLKNAYPNYFLDMRDFAEKLSVIISEAKE